MAVLARQIERDPYTVRQRNTGRNNLNKRTLMPPIADHAAAACRRRADVRGLRTGEARVCRLFVAALGASNYTVT